MTFSNMVLRGVLTLTCGLAVANLIRTEQHVGGR